MEKLQNKFEDLILNTRYHGASLEDILIQQNKVVKQCTILCLEEQVKLLESTYALAPLPSLWLAYQDLKKTIRTIER
jgi:hypothetical protein